MSNLFFQFDASAFDGVLEEFRNDLQKELNQAVSSLADMTLEKTLELASQDLHSTLHIYKDALSSRGEGSGVYVVALDLDKAGWIEEGLPNNFDMKPGLLNGKSGRTIENGPNAGKRMAIVPFKHDTKPSQTTPKAQELIDQVKKVLKIENIPFKKIEKDEHGSPRIGLLHKIDIDSAKPTAKASTPALQGVRIYQQHVKDEQGNIKKNKWGQEQVTRGIFTFRTVMEGSDKWMHPGLEKKDFLDKAFEWAQEKFDREIQPELLKKWESK